MDNKSKTAQPGKEGQHPWLHCLRMCDGTLQGDIGLAASCFVIAENTDDNASVRRLALDLMNGGCRDFHFCGNRRDQWHNAFDCVDIERSSDGKDWALTCDYGSTEEFAHAITQEYAWRTDAPGDFYLLYDSDEVFAKVLHSLKVQKKPMGFQS